MIALMIAIACFGMAYVLGHAEISLGARAFLFFFRGFKARCDSCQIMHAGVTTQTDDEPMVACPQCGKKVAAETGGAPFAFLVKLVECPACLGWWQGLFLGIALVIWKPTSVFAVVAWMEPVWLLPLYTAFTVCGSNFVLGRVTGLLPSKFHPVIQVLTIDGNGNPIVPLHIQPEFPKPPEVTKE